MGIKVLYDQSDVHREMGNLFKAPTVRRVAISAFVGKGAESYLPNPRGLTLVCWPKAGGTNPHALRKLMSNGVDVWFANRLHMKVYWAAGRGCVLTSANLSTNALGSGNLKEIGILIDPDDIDIDRILLSLDRRPATDSEMKKLDRAHARFVALNELRKGSSLPTFLQWLNAPMRSAWKLGWSDSYGELCKAAKDLAKEEFGIAEPASFLAALPQNYRRNGGEWILTFMLAKNTPTELTWMFCDRVVDVSPKDKQYTKDYPCQVVPIWPLARYPGCPFRIDKYFRNAFKRTVKRYGAERIRQAASMKPPEELIRLLTSELT